MIIKGKFCLFIESMLLVLIRIAEASFYEDLIKTIIYHEISSKTYLSYSSGVCSHCK